MGLREAQGQSDEVVHASSSLFRQLGFTLVRQIDVRNPILQTLQEGEGYRAAFLEEGKPIIQLSEDCHRLVRMFSRKHIRDQPMGMKMGSGSATSNSGFVWSQGNDARVLFVDTLEHVERLETDLSRWVTEVR